jgi:hypothetical protein
MHVRRGAASPCLALALLAAATVPGLQGAGSGTDDPALPKPRAYGKLTDADVTAAAKTLDCEVALIRAVNEVESSGSGFLPSRRPKILFEAHIFSRLTKHKYDKDHPGISSAKWDRSLYQRGEKEYKRLEEAMTLDRAAALQSASWGRFQIMGFNHKLAGYATLDAFVEDMYEAEGKHLQAFIAFLKNTKLDRPLREKRWADFARGYNGAIYQENRYDEKLQRAYEKFQE